MFKTTFAKCSIIIFVMCLTMSSTSTPDVRAQSQAPGRQSRPIPNQAQQPQKNSTQTRSAEKSSLVFGSGSQRVTLRVPDGWEKADLDDEMAEKFANMPLPFSITASQLKERVKALKFEMPNGCEALIIMSQEERAGATHEELKNVLNETYRLLTKDVKESHLIDSDQIQVVSNRGERLDFETTDDDNVKNRGVLACYYPHGVTNTPLFLIGIATLDCAKSLNSAIEFLMSQ